MYKGLIASVLLALSLLATTTAGSTEAPSVRLTVAFFFERHGAPELVAIAGCESKFRQYEADGRPLRNRQGSSATGVMQIMASVHAPEAEKMGLDIETLAGNLHYALHLYKSQGTRPWRASRHCWKKKL